MTHLLWKIPLLMLCLALSIGYAEELWALVVAADWSSESMVWFLSGVGLLLPVWFLFLRRAGFFSTFEHEFTHLLVGLLFFKKPHSFNVHHQSGGLVQMYGGNFLITLAPYFLPTLVLLELPFFWLLKPEFYPPFFGLMGFLTGFTILSGFQEFHFKQPDIRQCGIIFSTLFILFGNLVCLGFILAFVAGEFASGWEFLKSGPLWVWDLVNG